MIPCKDCITFAMCNAQMTSYDSVIKLLSKCSILLTFVLYSHDRRISSIQLSLVRKFFDEPYYKEVLKEVLK
jgi:hypothetical protein